MDSSQIQQFVRNLLTSLAPLNYTVFVYLTTFFREILTQADFNRTTPVRLAELCINAMTLNPLDADLPEERERRAARQRFLLPVMVYILTEKFV